MASEQSFWFRVGYALERAINPTTTAGERFSNLGAQSQKKATSDVSQPSVTWPLPDQVVPTALVAAASEVMEMWRPRRRARLTRLVRAGVSGAAAAVLLDLLKPILSGNPAQPLLDKAAGNRMLAGVSQGLLYGTIVEPHLPGPPILKGALFGCAEYAAIPAGGLSQLLGGHAPKGQLPVLASFFETVGRHDRAYVEHMVFGIALALIYESSPSNNGILTEEDLAE